MMEWTDFSKMENITFFLKKKEEKDLQFEMDVNHNNRVVF